MKMQNTVILINANRVGSSIKPGAESLALKNISDAIGQDLNHKTIKVCLLPSQSIPFRGPNDIPNITAELERILQQQLPNPILGISVCSDDLAVAENIAKVSKILKPDMPVIAGGPHFVWEDHLPINIKNTVELSWF